MVVEKLRPSFTFTQERLAELRQVVPEAFADGAINWEVLHDVFTPFLENEREGTERFGLFWPGKREARTLAAQPSKGTLLLAHSEGVNEETTGNIFIEGDNLEVLKLLQKSYAGQIKVIYIDPPYNTGNDFVYKDDFREPLEEYLMRTRQVDEEGKKQTTNTKSDGRYHSNWLNMMYPRLLLARQLLQDEGLIFVSIDDNELHNLRLIMNEIFGEENFLGCIVRATGTTTGQDSRGFGGSFDYVSVFSKNPKQAIGGIPLSNEDTARFSEEDEKGSYSLLQLRKTGNADRREDRPSMFYPVKSPDDDDIYPFGPSGYESRWRCGQSTYHKLADDNMIIWKRVKRDGNDQWSPYVKYYLEGREKRPSSLWTDLDGNKKATIELKELLGEKVFDAPKPVALLSR